LVLLTKYDKGDTMGRACWLEKRHAYGIFVGGRNMKEIGDLENLVIDGSIILKCIPNK
jgi:hypothetical protein